MNLFPIRIVVLAALLLGLPCEAQLPKILKDWQRWATWEETKNDGLPTRFDDRAQLMPLWFSAVQIQADAGGGSFTFSIEARNDGWAALPGDAQSWPQEVMVDEKVAAVVSRAGVPCVEVLAGQKSAVRGVFRWAEMPQSVRIPPQMGVLNLQLNGQPVELPVWDQKGLLWLQRTSTETEDKDFLAVQVYRLISDGSPQWLDTQVELSVAGKSREEALGSVLPVGWRLSSVDAPLPCAVDDAGKLKVQVRAGKWLLKISAFRTSPAQTVSYEKDAKPLVAEELVGLKHDPSFRLVEITGIPAVDVAQTTFPQDWRQYPVHEWPTAQTFEMDEKMRGMGAKKPPGITIKRSFWLDEDGKNMTYQDELHGNGQQTWRLDVAAGHKLGAVKIGGAGQLITKNPGSGAEGVEVRDRDLNLQAVGRLERGGKMAATGWRHDAESLDARLNLPPGWRLLAVFGADWSQGDWLTAWSLFDVFMLLIVTLAILRLWGLKTAAIGLLGFLAAYHEMGAPRLTWVILVAVLATAKWLPGTAAQPILNKLKLAALVLFALNAVPFIIQQVQQAVHPQLEPYRSTWQAASNDMDSDLAAGGIREQMNVAVSQVANAIPSSRYEYEKPEKANLKYDTKAKIQTGPAVPQWRWREVAFGWRGPVSAGEQVSLWLIPSDMERLITLLRVGLMLLLVWLLLGRGKDLPPLPKFVPSATTSAAVLFLMMMAFSSSASAQFPSKDMLKQLSERVLADRKDLPQRAEIPQVRLRLNGRRLEMSVEIHASELVAVPLPGKLPSWSPVTVSDGATTMRHEGYVWVLAERGVKTVTVTGMIPPGAEWQWSFLLKPRQVSIDAAGWTVTGMKANGVPEDQVFFVEQNRSASSEAAYDQKDFFPVVQIERELELGLIWQVRTRVKRLSPAGKAISLSLPLLSGERVMSAGMTAGKNRIEVRLGAADAEIGWESEVAPVELLELKAETSESWVEHWSLITSPIWNVKPEGLAPVYEPRQAQLMPVWTPWPGESVKLSVSRPEAVQGGTTTVHQARHTTRLGDRQHTASLTLQVQASLGEDFRIELPAEAEITTLRVRGQELPVRRESSSIIIPLRPGDQELNLSWKTPSSLGFSTRTDTVKLPVQASNITTEVTMPSSRWLLWATGPRRGPAVRFWGMLIAAALFGMVLARTKLSPLKGHEWALIMLGFMQLPLYIGGAVVLWFFALAWRGSFSAAKSSVFRFNAMQLILSGASLIALLCMLAVVHQGLLGRPEMFVAGYGSTTESLQWFQDRTADTHLTQPVISSVSIWFYRALMLLWALWLARNVLRWIPWAYQQLMAGGFWRKREVVQGRPPMP
jgi:hypothetical protein